jgi:hypothetical protein
MGRIPIGTDRPARRTSTDSTTRSLPSLGSGRQAGIVYWLYTAPCQWVLTRDHRSSHPCKCLRCSGRGSLALAGRQARTSLPVSSTSRAAACHGLSHAAIQHTRVVLSRGPDIQALCSGSTGPGLKLQLDARTSPQSLSPSVDDFGFGNIASGK